MHELGILFEIEKRLEQIVEEESLEGIEAVVLEVGELSSVVPEYLEECWPAAIDGTIFKETELVIETVEGIVRCKECKNEYNLIQGDGVCVYCGHEQSEYIQGKEFNIKEVVAY